MDSVDKRLLEILAEDSSRSITKIGSMLGLSVPAVNKRIAKLRSSGVIERYTIKTNAKLVGKPVQGIVLLVVDKYAQVSDLFDFIDQTPDIVECYAVTGEYDYLIKIYAQDIERLEEILLTLKSKHCVAKSHTMFLLKEHKNIPGPFPE